MTRFGRSPEGPRPSTFEEVSLSTEKKKLAALAVMDEQGRKIGYNQKPEVGDYPVLGCVGALHPQQLETMAHHMDRMKPDERERVTKALMDFGSLESVTVSATLAGMPLGYEPPPEIMERYPYLSQYAFRQGDPRYCKR